MDQPDKRARELAREIVDQIGNLDALGRFASQDTHENKVAFAALVLRNYACERMEELQGRLDECLRQQEWDRGGPSVLGTQGG